jgi:hypothetical protein
MDTLEPLPTIYWGRLMNGYIYCIEIPNLNPLFHDLPQSPGMYNPHHLGREVSDESEERVLGCRPMRIFNVRLDRPRYSLRKMSECYDLEASGRARATPSKSQSIQTRINEQN